MNKEDLQEGDVIFIAIPNPLYRRVARGTGSRASHVGIVLKDAEGEWVVAESAVPLSRYTTYDDFLKRTDNGWYCIRRLKTPLSAAAISRLKQECDRRMGVLYHLGFKFDSRRLFCSKFVYEVFRDALGVPLGQLETLRELHAKLPHVPLTFWRIWYLGRIPWSRITVTPASQMHSELLETVYDASLAAS
ncbi:MAG: hypothetical protein KDJ24_06585 [Gammaproteobacteria bacterium]|nr:hypothetical protein [Gammaproteobacteria bacterium]